MNTPHNNQQRRGSVAFSGAGFSIVELLSVVAVVSNLAAAAILTGAKTLEASKATKFEADVATINSDDNGFVEGAKFLIYEGATATGKIYGRFVPSY